MTDERMPSPSEATGLPAWIAGGLLVSDALDGWVQCGVDLVEIDRIEQAASRWGARFLDRVWTGR
ncbi:MAG: hypothetical protein WCD37_02905, partial [Chloroflexia bacterium]